MDKKSKVSPLPDEDETKVAVLGYPPLQPPLPHHHYPGYPLPAPAYHPGFPPSPSPYATGPPGYPNHHHQYPPMQTYYQPPQHPGYYNAAAVPPHVEFEPRRKLLLARVILCLLVFLILGTAAMSVLTYVVFGSAVPFFDVVAFSVPSFNLSDNSLAGTWQANFTVENPNHGLDVMFERIESMVYYNEFLLANKVEKPMELKRDGKAVLATRLWSPASKERSTGEPPLKEMKSELDGTRSLEFRLAMGVLATFKSGSDLSRRMTFTVVCYGLKTQFKDIPGVGVWDGVKPTCTLIF